MGETQSDRIGRIVNLQNNSVQRKVLVTDDPDSALSYSAALQLTGEEICVKYLYTIPEHFGWDWPYQNPIIGRAIFEGEDGEQRSCGVPTSWFMLNESNPA